MALNFSTKVSLDNLIHNTTMHGERKEVIYQMEMKYMVSIHSEFRLSRFDMDRPIDVTFNIICDVNGIDLNFSKIFFSIEIQLFLSDQGVHIRGDSEYWIDMVYHYVYSWSSND